MAWDPTQPPAGGALVSAPIRENFAALDSILADILGAGNPFNFGIEAGPPITFVADENFMFTAFGVNALKITTEKVDHINNLLVGGMDIDLGTDAEKVIGIIRGVAPTTSPADMVQLYAADLAGAGTTGLVVRDEAGNFLRFGPDPAAVFQLVEGAITYFLGGGGFGTLSAHPIEIYTNNNLVAVFTTGLNFGLGTTSFGTNLAKGFVIGSGTAPTTSPADAVQMWVDDWLGVAGDASLHIRDEQGRVHKIMGDASFSGYELAVGTCLLVLHGLTTEVQLGTNSAHPIVFRANSVNNWRITATGMLEAITDNALDIGASGANRPRNYFGAGNVLVGGSMLSAGATAGIGYATGAGGTVTQATSKSTAVTLNKLCGDITMNAAALAANTTVSFQLNSTALAVGDQLILNHASGGTMGAYNLNARAPAAGNVQIDVRNITGGSLSEAIVIRYTIIKAVLA